MKIQYHYFICSYTLIEEYFSLTKHIFCTAELHSSEQDLPVRFIHLLEWVACLLEKGFCETLKQDNLITTNNCLGFLWNNMHVNRRVTNFQTWSSVSIQVFASSVVYGPLIEFLWFTWIWQQSTSVTVRVNWIGNQYPLIFPVFPKYFCKPHLERLQLWTVCCTVMRHFASLEWKGASGARSSAGVNIWIVLK